MEFKEPEEKLKILSYMVEQSTEGMALADLKGNIIFSNMAWSKMHGYENPEDYSGRNLEIFHSKEQLENDVIPFNKKVKTQGTYSGEVEHITKEGKIFPTLMTTTLLKDPQGNPFALAGIAKDITESKQLEKDHIKNIELLSKTAMQFVDFPQDKNIYTFIGEQLREFAGKKSYIIVNSIDVETTLLTTQAVIGMGKLSEKVAGLLGHHPVGKTYDADNDELDYLSDGKLHLYKEGLYGISLKLIPKIISNSIEKLLNIKSIFTIGFARNNVLFGTVIIALKENTEIFENKQIIETFIKQASIALQKRQAEEALMESNENFQQVVSNIATIIWRADIADDGTFENTYISPVADKLLALSAGTLKNDCDNYSSYINLNIWNT